MTDGIGARLGVDYVGPARREKLSSLIGERVVRAWRVHAHQGDPRGKWIHFATRNGRRGKVHQTSHEIIWHVTRVSE